MNNPMSAKSTPPIKLDGINDFLRRGILLLRTFPITKKTRSNPSWTITAQTLPKLANEKSHITNSFLRDYSKYQPYYLSSLYRVY